MYNLESYVDVDVDVDLDVGGRILLKSNSDKTLTGFIWPSARYSGCFW
jgi:hypothetical protein